MSKAPEDQTRIWVRDTDGNLHPQVDSTVKIAGMKKADWLYGVIEFALRQDDPLFF